MKNFLNFLNRNLTKIIWMLAILVWVGVGIYYFSTYPSSFSLPFTSQESLPPTPTVSELLKKTESIPDSIIGYFKGWEQVSGSKDNYLLLTDRVTGELLPKIRIILESDSTYGNVTSLSNIKIEKDEKMSSDEMLVFDPLIKEVSFEEVEKLVQSGDTVKVFLKQVDKDENNNFSADRVGFFGKEITK